MNLGTVPRRPTRVQETDAKGLANPFGRLRQGLDAR